VEQAEREAGDGYRDQLDDRPNERVHDAEDEASEDEGDPLVEVAEAVRHVAIGDGCRRKDAVHDIGGDEDRNRVDEGAPDDLHRRKA